MRLNSDDPAASTSDGLGDDSVDGGGLDQATGDVNAAGFEIEWNPVFAS